MPKFIVVPYVGPVGGGSGGGNTGGLSEAEVDARVRALVADQAEQGNSSTWAVSKLGTGTTGERMVLHGDGTWKETEVVIFMSIAEYNAITPTDRIYAIEDSQGNLQQIFFRDRPLNEVLVDDWARRGSNLTIPVVKFNPSHVPIFSNTFTGNLSFDDDNLQSFASTVDGLPVTNFRIVDSLPSTLSEGQILYFRQDVTQNVIGQMTPAQSSQLSYFGYIQAGIAPLYYGTSTVTVGSYNPSGGVLKAIGRDNDEGINSVVVDLPSGKTLSHLMVSAGTQAPRRINVIDYETSDTGQIVYETSFSPVAGVNYGIQLHYTDGTVEYQPQTFVRGLWLVGAGNVLRRLDN